MLNNRQNIGRLDKLITFQKKVIGTNESNEDEQLGWENIDFIPTVRAQVDDRSGAEVYRAAELTGIKIAIFTIRWRNDISVKNRIIYDNQKWDIHVILNGSRKGYLDITAESGGQYQEISGPGFTMGYSLGFRS